MSLSHRHTDCHTHTCAERARRRLNTLGVAILRMTRGQGTVLTELHHIFLGQAVAEQVKKGVKKRRAVSAGEDEPVTVRPIGVGGIVLHMLCPKLICNSSRAERKTRMTGLRLLDRISRENADGVDRHRIDRFAHILDSSEENSPCILPARHRLHASRKACVNDRQRGRGRERPQHGRIPR